VLVANAFTARLQAAMTHDAEVTRTFMRVAGLVDAPDALMSPENTFRVLGPELIGAVLTAHPELGAELQDLVVGVLLASQKDAATA
jgi:hypothetical protein